MNKKNKIIASFTLGYMLNLVLERLCDESNKSSLTEVFLLMHKNRIIKAIQSLHYELFSKTIVLEEYPKLSSEFILLLKNIYDEISEKNHWGDDSFLETAFLSGSFLSIVESFDEERFDLHMFEQILSDLLVKINVTIDYKQFSSTVTNIRSKVLSDRICSRDEIFYMISGKNSNHKEIQDIQHYIDNPSVLYSVCLA